MRKIIALEFMTLDGVIQAPGGRKEDPEAGFKYGGWTVPYSDKVSGKAIQKEMKPADLLLGRKTYDIFAGYWPDHADFWPRINEVKKYVLSKTLKKTHWKNSVILRSLAELKKLKKSKGPGIKVWGSSELLQLLLKNDLVDELWIKIFPVVLGKGKKLFGGGAIPAAFKLKGAIVTPSGVILTQYKRAGKVKTGTVGE